MADTRFTLTHRFLLAAIVVAVASLTACGGSSDSTSPDDGNGPPVVDNGSTDNGSTDNGSTDNGGADNGAVDDSVLTGGSADCFNEAMYRTGSTWTIKTRTTASSTLYPATTSEYSEQATVKGATNFDGHAVTEIEYSAPGDDNKSWEYTAIADGKLITYGYKNLYAESGDVSTARFVPPMEFPLSMVPNETYKFGPVSLEMDLPPSSADMAEPIENITTSNIIYLGQETITVPAGTFVTCKGHEVTENKSVTNVNTPAGAMSITATTVTDSYSWTVAEGPYRGLLVQSIGDTAVTTSPGAGGAIEHSFDSQATELSANFK